MPARSVAQCRSLFEERIDSLLQFADESRGFHFITPNGSRTHIGSRRREMIVGMTLLHSHIAWEDFLETVFVRFLCGAVPPTGGAPILIRPRFSNNASAMSDMLASFGSGKFLNWSESNTLRYAARYFHLGEPFATSIGSVKTTSSEMNVIRNRFAHRSLFSRLEFQRIVTSRLGYVPRGMTVGRFLTGAAPTGTGASNMLDYYTSELKVAASAIVP